jgi:hypothetical protein
MAELAAGADPTTTLVYRLIRIADTWRGIGVDDDVIGALLVRRLMEQGVDEIEAVQAVAAAGIGWRPKEAA